MNNNTNEQTFFYEVCNLWNNEGPTSKNLQCFFIFSYTKGDNYFKVPNLSMKIKTKSDYDNTEVKAFVSYETLPVLINSLQDHINNQHIENESVQYSAHNFTFSLTVVDEQRSKLKFTNNDGISNDIILYRGRLKDLARTLRITYDNIITISLNFIKLSQNSEILDRLTSIESTVRKVIGSNQQVNIPNNNIIQEPIVQDTPTSNIFTNQVEVVNLPNADPSQVHFTTLPNIQPESTRVMLMENNNVSVQQDNQTVSTNISTDVELPDDDTPPFDVDNFSVDSPSVVSNIMPSLQDTLNNVVQAKVNEPTYISLKDKINDIMYKASLKELSISDMVQQVIESFTLLTSARINDQIIRTVEDMAAFFNIGFSSFSLYMRKLMFLLEHHLDISADTKVPMFIMRVKFPIMYANITKDFNIALLMLYEEYRNRNAQADCTQSDKFILSCLRYVFGPFWTSYLNVADVNDLNNKLFNNLKNATSRFLVNWEEVYMSNLDSFIYNAGLAFNYESTSNVEKFFSEYCPTIDWCLNTQDDNITIDDVIEVNRIVNTLKTTYSFEDIILKPNSNLHIKLTKNFIDCLMVFSKKNNFDENTDITDIRNMLTFVVSNLKEGNNRELIKAMESIDTNNGEMKVLSSES